MDADAEETADFAHLKLDFLADNTSLRRC